MVRRRKKVGYHRCPGSPFEKFKISFMFHENLLKYSCKSTNVCRLVPLLTEKSRSVCKSKVETLCMSEGGRFGWGVWCITNKTKLHWSDPHNASDKDAAKRAVRVLPINFELPGGRRLFLWALCTTFARKASNGAQPRCCYRPARS